MLCIESRMEKIGWRYFREIGDARTVWFFQTRKKTNQFMWEKNFMNFQPEKAATSVKTDYPRTENINNKKYEK